jgi:hypothetical protein
MKYSIPLVCLLFSSCLDGAVSHFEAMEPSLFILTQDNASFQSCDLLVGHEKYIVFFPDMPVSVHDSDEYVDLMHMTLLDRWETLVWFLSKDTDSPCSLNHFSLLEKNSSLYYGFSFCTTCAYDDMNIILKISVQKKL